MTIADDLATLREAPDSPFGPGDSARYYDALARVEAEIARLREERDTARRVGARGVLDANERAEAAEAQVAGLRDEISGCGHVKKALIVEADACRERMKTAEAEVAGLRDGVRLVLRGIPDPMHPSIRPEWVDKMVAAQIVALDLIGENDGEDVEKARALLAEDYNGDAIMGGPEPDFPLAEDGATT